MAIISVGVCGSGYIFCTSLWEWLFVLWKIVGVAIVSVGVDKLPAGVCGNGYTFYARLWEWINMMGVADEFSDFRDDFWG